MKKVFTLLFTASIIASSFAQSDIRMKKSRAITTSYRTNASIKPYELINRRDDEISIINSQNSYQVQVILNRDKINIWEKRDLLNNLEAARIEKINSIYANYNNEMAYYKGVEKNNSFYKKPHRD